MLYNILRSQPESLTCKGSYGYVTVNVKISLKADEAEVPEVAEEGEEALD